MKITAEIVKIGACIVGMVISGAVQLITMLLALAQFESVYFVLLATSLQLAIVFFVAFVVVSLVGGAGGAAGAGAGAGGAAGAAGSIAVFPPNHFRVIVASGVFYTIMCILKMYSGNPDRTPPVFQCVVAGLAIFPNVLFTKFIIKKKNVAYDKRFIIPSVLCLLSAVGITTIPIATDSSTFKWMTLLWVVLYLIGVCSRSLYCVLQEFYFVKLSADGVTQPTLSQKLELMCYTNLASLLFTAPILGLEYGIGYSIDAPPKALINSFIMFTTNGYAAGMLEAFIASYIVFYAFSVYLNSYSSNYNMIATLAITPIVAIFFTIFAGLGVAYPWYIVVPSLFLSITSIVLWMFGENKQVNGSIVRDVTGADGFSAISSLSSSDERKHLLSSSPSDERKHLLSSNTED